MQSESTSNSKSKQKRKNKCFFSNQQYNRKRNLKVKK